MKKIDVAGATVSVREFSCLDRARTAAEGWGEWIVMGDYDDDGGVYWTCRPVDAGRLVNAGYELVR